jgi:trk system potassium uptake protein TrkH
MNLRNIINVTGYVLLITGIFMLLPAAVGLLYREYDGALIFLSCAMFSALIGMLLTRFKKSDSARFTVKDGYVTVALCWLGISLIGALPFCISGEIPSYLDALFEIVSGFTTTGASILNDVEALSHCMLLWRSFSHWIGGMGVLVFILTILPLAKSGSSFSLMQAESPGPIVSKLVPRLRASARHLYGIYLGITLLEMLLLALGRMPLFDNLCITFGTMGTGGFGVLNSSIASYSPYLQWVITIFMLLAGTNFGLFFLLLCRQWKAAAQIEEVRWFYIIVAAATVLISLNLRASGQFDSVREVLFQVASIITTTGFATTDFDVWPMFSKGILLLLMFLGACAGSTGGGIKISRLLIYVKSAIHELQNMSKPRAVHTIRMDGKKLDVHVIHGALLFLVCYVLIYVVSLLVILLENVDFETSFSAVAATLNNIGPGFNLVGPTCNFSFFSPLSKIVLIFDMLAGRLELFPLLILFSPKTWQN